MTPLLSALLRELRCRRDGHLWTLMADPPACARCGRTGRTHLTSEETTMRKDNGYSLIELCVAVLVIIVLVLLIVHYLPAR